VSEWSPSGCRCLDRRFLDGRYLGYRCLDGRFLGRNGRLGSSSRYLLGRVGCFAFVNVGVIAIVVGKGRIVALVCCSCLGSCVGRCERVYAIDDFDDEAPSQFAYAKLRTAPSVSFCSTLSSNINISLRDIEKHCWIVMQIQTSGWLYGTCQKRAACRRVAVSAY
jgi:hypothetical protein